MPETSIERVQDIETRIEKTIKDCGIIALKDQSALMQAVKMARGIKALTDALPLAFVEEVFMPLMGSPLGFLTDLDADRDGRRYGAAEVRACIIEGMLRGFRPVGNEMNIISGRFYAAKNGLERNVREYPGMGEIQIEPGVPRINPDGNGALVPMIACWIHQGKFDTIRCEFRKEGEREFDSRIPVRVNKVMGVDGIIGKAKRKLFARIYERLTGYKVDDGDANERSIDTEGTTVEEKKSTRAINDLVAKHQAAVAAKKNGNGAANGEQKPAEPAEQTPAQGEQKAAEAPAEQPVPPAQPAEPKAEAKPTEAPAEPPKGKAAKAEKPMRESGDDTDEIAQRGK